MAFMPMARPAHFPTQSFKDTNYWVDVVLQAGPAPTLSSIAVTPANPTVATGATQQFTATGTYSDGSTQNITTQVTWSSSSTSVASITHWRSCYGELRRAIQPSRPLSPA